MDKKSRELVMAKLYFKNKDYKMAENSFIEYLNMNPEDVTALKLLAQVYEQNKRYDKAFEMYERCYLAEPERTGTLLDICRILLMNGVWLDNVDYRKWLNLAIKAFPSNPIVVNYKAFLSTLPLDDHQVPLTNTKIVNGDDPLRQVLEKLNSINDRLELIESKIDSLTSSSGHEKLESILEASLKKLSIQSTSSPGKFQQKNIEEKVVLNEKKDEVIRIEKTPTVNTFSMPPIETKTVKEEVKSPFGNSFQMYKFGDKENKEHGQEKVPAPSLFDGGLKKFSMPIQGTWSSLKTEPENTTKKDEVILGEKKNEVPSIEKMPTFNSFNLLSLETKTPKENKNAPFGNGFQLYQFGAVSASQDQGQEKPAQNLFEASLKKFDIPLQGTWSSVKNEPENNEENDEVVPNEELPIENTCDMQPIEIKTGEEDEDVLFEHRCKLYRFRDKEYKERGLGSIKVLKHRSTGAGRLIMRREAVGLVCLNCWGLSKVEKVKDTQIRFAGIDASDGDPEPTAFIVRFKTPELTEQFLGHVSELSQNTSSSSP